MPMFSQWISLDRCVILELAGSSVECLTSNRDGLVRSKRVQLEEFLDELSTDKKQALKDKRSRYEKFGGAKFRHSVSKGVSARELVGDAVKTQAILRFAQEQPIKLFNSVGEKEEGDFQPDVRVSQISEEFILKNETDMKIPDYYRPDHETFGAYGKKLARMWGRLVLELHKMLNLEATFSIGFVFDEDSEAQFEDGAHGLVYYLNPAKVVQQAGTASKSFKKRFLLTERNRILAIAAHEGVHGLGFSRHDDEFASKITDVLGQVMDERKRFNWCFA
jgi:hypothetical protein